MKSAIDHYYGPTSKATNSSPSVPMPASKASSKKVTDTNSSEQNCTEDVVNGKENLKTNKKGKDVKSSKEKVKTSLNSAPKDVKKKKVKKKSLSIKKLAAGKDDVEDEAPGKDNEILNCQSPNFSLKIKLKSKETNDADAECLIEEFSSPDRVSPTISKLNESKSPQGTMLQYLIPPKKPSEVEKDNKADSKLKGSKEISDFFSPKSKEASLIVENGKEKTIARNDSGDVKEECRVSGNDGVKTATKTSAKCGSKSLSVSKKKQSSTQLPTKLNENKADSKAENNKRNSSSSKKSTTLKKSLSLSKNEISAKNMEPEEGGHTTQTPVNITAEPAIVQSMNQNFRKILAKTAVVVVSDINSCSSPENSKSNVNKRKRGSDDDGENVLGNKLLEPDGDDSPVKSKRKLCKANNIGSDSDDDSSNKLKTRESSELLKISNDSDVKGDADVLAKAEDSKRNSLMNYFSKVSKEELQAKTEKVELKVKAMVHSPPTTPSKKEKRRSINSLPGGAASLAKRKGSSSAVKLKENMNAIDVICVEELKASESKSKDLISVQMKKKPPRVNPNQSQGGESEKLSMSSKKTLISSKSSDSPGVKTSKKALLKSKPKDIANKDHGTKSIDVEHESLATPLISPPDQQDSSPQLSWKMRVCLPTQGLPSSQGTLLEEESDGEEIFVSQTKKRKLNRKSLNSKSKQANGDIDLGVLKNDDDSLDIIIEKETCPDVKIAPLFTRKVDSQARQQFLQSGVPEQVKRVLETQRSYEEQEQETPIFPRISHVQQRMEEDWVWNLPIVNVPVLPDAAGEEQNASDPCSHLAFPGWSNIKKQVAHIQNISNKGPEMCSVYGLPIDVVKPILRLIKKESPDFKVVNTFKVLRSKFREEEIAKAAALSASSDTPRPKRKSSNRKSNSSLTVPPYRATIWTEKYRPCTASEIVGNGESIQQLKRWLEAWRQASEDASKLNSTLEMKNKKKKKGGIDDDDFVVSDDSSNDGGINLPVGVAVLYGPNGSGKTCSVYAIAKDLGYKVLEVNASEKRNGKLVLSKLSEATQSHQVQQGSEAQGFAALFGKKLSTPKNSKAKSGKSPKNIQQLEEEKTKKMSLILFEDVDVVFDEEDEGFLSAISNLVLTSKRPVILTTTDPENSSVNRFFNNSSLILKFISPVNTISTWLQIVSVVEGIFSSAEAVKDLVLLCKGDFRRALLQMQLWVTSGGNNLPKPTLMVPHTIRKSKKKASKSDVTEDDELSGDDEETDCNPSIPANPDCIAAMLGTNTPQNQEESDNSDEMSVECRHVPLNIPFPLDVGCFWWNIPPMLSLRQVKHAPLPVPKEPTPLPRTRKMLDESFLATFCEEEADISKNAANEDANATCSQGARNEDSQEVDKGNIDSSSMDTVSYQSACTKKEMSSIAYQMTCLSSLDVIAASSHLVHPSNLEPVGRFSQLLLKDSLSLDMPDNEGPSYMLKSLAQEICYWLGVECLTETRQTFAPEDNDNSLFSQYNPCLPNQEELRWREAHAETEQAALAAVPVCMYLERQALSTDYVPTLRTLCRLEQYRSETSSKRNSRFYHYLRNTVASLTDTQLEILCHTMCDR